MANPGIIVQARTGSKRFPRKIFAKLGRARVIDWVLMRCDEIGIPVYLAVPEADKDRIYADYYGSEHDVLERYYKCAAHYRIDPIMRITADCPLLQPKLCQRVLEKYQTGNFDYVAIDHPRGGWPKGYGCEVFSFNILEMAHKHAITPEDREHVTPWMQRKGRCKYLKNRRDRSHVNFCVDYPEDIERLAKFFVDKSEVFW